jgi:anti-anti-sigma factor
MEMEKIPCTGGAIVALAGRLDGLTSDTVKSRLLDVIQGTALRLVIDFAGVTYISSAGLRVLLEVAKRVAAVKGKLVLCAMGRDVRQVFDLAGFAALMPLCASREEALALPR